MDRLIRLFQEPKACTDNVMFQEPKACTDNVMFQEPKACTDNVMCLSTLCPTTPKSGYSGARWGFD